jgi:hypothetical protein
MVFENRVLTTLFGRMKDKETRNWMCNEELVSIIKSMRKRWVGRVTRMGELRNAYKIVVQMLK